MIRMVYSLVFIFSFVIGRLVGEKTYVLFYSLEISHGVSLFVTFVLAAVVFSIVIDPIENKYLWANNKKVKDFWFDRFFMSLAPINTGLTSGVISIWALELLS